MNSLRSVMNKRKGHDLYRISEPVRNTVLATSYRGESGKKIDTEKVKRIREYGNIYKSLDQPQKTQTPRESPHLKSRKSPHLKSSSYSKLVVLNHNSKNENIQTTGNSYELGLKPLEQIKSFRHLST